MIQSTVPSVSYLNAQPLSTFLDTLVSASLAPVLHAHVPSNPASDEQLTPFLVSLEPQIQSMARSLYYRVNLLSVDLQDLTQEGMIAAWKATRRYDPEKAGGEGSFRGFCLKAAKGAMKKYLTYLNRTPARSLDEYLSGENEQGRPYVRDIEERKVTRRLASRDERIRILAALDKLSRKERLVITALYRVERRDGRVGTLDTLQACLKMNDKAIENARARALRKLATLLEVRA